MHPVSIDRLMSPRYLVLRLEGPMVAFGDVMIDSFGPIRETPSTSAICGLLANALGFRRESWGKLQQLQDRLILASRVDHVDRRFTDYQTAQLDGRDRNWTTDGKIQKRAGATYDSSHIRLRDYDCSVRIAAVLRLRDDDQTPTLDDLASALEWPARPLFLGRKCCLPSAPLFSGFVEGGSAYDALRLTSSVRPQSGRDRFRSPVDDRVLVSLPGEEPCPEGFETVLSTERRDWPGGVHAGLQSRYRGMVDRSWFATEQSL